MDKMAITMQSLKETLSKDENKKKMMIGSLAALGTAGLVGGGLLLKKRLTPKPKKKYWDTFADKMAIDIEKKYNKLINR